MGRMIEIDDDIFEWLQQHAEPLVDNESAVLRRYLPMNGATQPATRAWSGRSGDSGTRSRPKLNEKVLRALGVAHFVVDGRIRDYGGRRAHPRAYLDAMIDIGKTSTPYFERWNEEGRPNPRGDAASRVILKVGIQDDNTRVCFHDGRETLMADFIRAFLDGGL